MTQIKLNNHDLFKGALLGRSGNKLIGWVYSLARPDEVVSIDLIGDGQWLGSVRAELKLPFDDLPFEAIGHGFVFTINSHNWQSIARFEVWVTNHDHRLEGVFFTHQEHKFLTQVKNTQVKISAGLHLVGWAWDSLDTAVNQKIMAYEAGKLIVEGLANQYSATLEVIGGSYVNHGFNLTLPLELADGRVHKIDVLMADGTALKGSPVTIIAPVTTLMDWTNSLVIPQPDQELLTALMKRYSWRFGVSTDFSFYQQWRGRFVTIKACAYSNRPVLVCISGAEDLHKTLISLTEQTHINWLALVCTEESIDLDSRIHAIAANKWLVTLQAAITEATGIVSFIMAGDTLSADALASLVEVFEDSMVQIVYTDCDQFSGKGDLMSPWFKPDWDPDSFLASHLLHYLFATRPVNLALNSPHLNQLEAWPWLAVQVVGDNPHAIYHIPRVLYHQRNGALSLVHLEAQHNCDQLLAPELTRTILSTGDNAFVWSDPSEWPLVSLIIPTRDHVDLLSACVESLLKTDYPNMEIIVMDNDSTDVEALAYLEQLNLKHIKVIKHPGHFNFSAINNHGVQQASGSIIGLINNDIEATHPNWLKVMVRQLLRPNVGAVGAKLLWPNGMVQHAGVLLGLHGWAGHTGNDWYKDDAGYFGYNQMTRSVSAVTAACLICRRDDYNAVGGLDETAFPVNFNDVDFCLKLRKLGKRIIWTPEAQLIHAESASRGLDVTPARKARMAREQNRLMQKWHLWIHDDPYYNPNLNLDSYSYAGLAIPPRQRTVLIF
jgi:GT2 family glycosyltransferase